MTFMPPAQPLAIHIEVVAHAQSIHGGGSSRWVTKGVTNVMARCPSASASRASLPSAMRSVAVAMRSVASADRTSVRRRSWSSARLSKPRTLLSAQRMTPKNSSDPRAWRTTRIVTASGSSATMDWRTTPNPGRDRPEGDDPGEDVDEHRALATLHRGAEPLAANRNVGPSGCERDGQDDAGEGLGAHAFAAFGRIRISRSTAASSRTSVALRMRIALLRATWAATSGSRCGCATSGSSRRDSQRGSLTTGLRRHG